MSSLPPATTWIYHEYIMPISQSAIEFTSRMAATFRIVPGVNSLVCKAILWLFQARERGGLVEYAERRSATFRTVFPDSCGVTSCRPSPGSHPILVQIRTNSMTSSLRSPCSIRPTQEWCTFNSLARSRMLKPLRLRWSFSHFRKIWNVWERRRYRFLCKI